MSTTSSPINDRKDILAALEIALAEHCWSPEKSKEAMDKFRSEFEAKDIFNARTLKKHHEKLDLTVGQRDVLDDVLSLIDGPVVAATTQSTASGAASQSHTTGAGGQQPIVIKIDKDKVPREMRDKELVTAFATKSERTADVIEEARRRFGSRKFFVLNEDGTVNVDKTMARQEDDDDNSVYEGMIVENVEEALERDFAADPVNGTKLNKAFKATDGVRWNDKARLFVIYLRKTGKGGVTAHMQTDARANLADRLKSFPQDIPSYLEDAYTEFQHAVRKKQPIIAQCEAEMQYRPMQGGSGGYGNGGYGERTVRQPDGGAWRGDGSISSAYDLHHVKSGTRAEAPFIVFLHDENDSHLIMELEKHLAPAANACRINLWKPGSIMVGQNTYQEIKQAITKAKVIVIGLSPDMLTNQASMIEMALEQSRVSGTTLVPVLLRHCMPQEKLTALQTLPRSGDPISSQRSPDKTNMEIAHALLQAAGVGGTSYR